VEAAFRAVPRHLFLAAVGIADVYTDGAFPTKHANGKPINARILEKRWTTLVVSRAGNDRVLTGPAASL